MKYYDTVTKGFYEETAADRIEITDEHWQELLNKQSEGGTILASDNNVYCVLASETIKNGAVVDISNTEAYKAKQKAKNNAIIKQDILKQLSEIDAKTIRALREGNTERIAQYEAQAQDLREQLNATM